MLLQVTQAVSDSTSVMPGILDCRLINSAAWRCLGADF